MAVKVVRLVRGLSGPVQLTLMVAAEPDQVVVNRAVVFVLAVVVMALAVEVVEVVLPLEELQPLAKDIMVAVVLALLVKAVAVVVLDKLVAMELQELWEALVEMVFNQRLLLF